MGNLAEVVYAASCTEVDCEESTVCPLCGGLLCPEHVLDEDTLVVCVDLGGSCHQDCHSEGCTSLSCYGPDPDEAYDMMRLSSIERSA